MTEHTTKPFWKSKKWMTSLLAALVPVANVVFGLDLDVAEVTAVVVPFVAYIIGQAAVDTTH